MSHKSGSQPSRCLTDPVAPASSGAFSCWSGAPMPQPTVHDHPYIKRVESLPVKYHIKCQECRHLLHQMSLSVIKIGYKYIFKHCHAPVQVQVQFSPRSIDSSMFSTKTREGGSKLNSAITKYGIHRLSEVSIHV